MAAPGLPPSIETLTLPVHRHILSIYSNVLETFYKSKVKGDDKKRRQALEDDDWRYQTLPDQIRGQRPNRGLCKEELERLVTWKITHQTNRPFLLPQIRKNDPKAVQKCTTEAYNILITSNDDGPSIADVRKALDKMCELTGVGPATGTLVLSVFDRTSIPFFEDELYAWLFPEFKGKLKYSTKEYFGMVEKLQEAKLMDGSEQDRSWGAEIEKIAFVCQHWDCVDNQEKTKIKGLMDKGEHVQDIDTTTGSKGVNEEFATEQEESDQGHERKAKSKRPRTKVDVDQQQVRRSKRTKTRQF